MQLDRPSKRRPRAPNRPPRDAERRPRQSDPFSQQHPFESGPTTRQTPAPVPFSTRATQDPFQPPVPGFAASGRGQPAPFAAGDAFAQNAPFGQPAFGQPAFGMSSFGQPAPFAQSAPAFAKMPDPFEQKPPPFGQGVIPFGKPSQALKQKGAFGQKGMTIDQKPPLTHEHTDNERKRTPSRQKGMTLDQNAVSVGEHAESGQKRTLFRQKGMMLDQTPPSMADTTSFPPSSIELEQQARTPTRRRLKSAFGNMAFDYKPATPSRGRDLEADLEIEQESDAFQTTPEADRRKPQTSKPNQLLLKSVPLSLFSRAALQRHFLSVPGVHVTHVSLRGSRRPDSRRTAVIAFSTEQQASSAMRNGQNFKGSNLQLSLFRQSAHAQSEHIGNESNEVFFNYVPESLFSEESIKDLFDNISENGVTKVSLKERPHYGSVKRTAIITFSSVEAAAMALRSLPLYKGRTLAVSFRRTRQPISGTAFPAGRYGDEDSTLRKGSGKSGWQEDEELEEDALIDLPPEDGDGKSNGYDDVSDGDEQNTGYAETDHEEEHMPISATTNTRVEIVRLREAIKRKERERKKLIQGDKGKREKKLAIPKTREPSMTGREGSNSGWRKVGEKVDIKHAANFVGTCMTMCPLKEFEERIIQRDVSQFETDDAGEPSIAKAVKKYRRSAAISEQPSPDEVRPPDVLLATMEHLKTICDLTDAKSADIHNFVRDRTRSLRQDFTLQGVRDESCIRIHEESVRFHILSEHRLYGADPAMFSSTQNLEQLDKCLISLREMYDLRRDNDLETSPNEPEMQAYYILTQMSDPKTCVQLCTGFAQDVRSSRPVQFALHVVRAASEGFGSFTRYFSLVRSAPYLMACLMHSRFSAVRTRALAVINMTHGNPNSRDNIPVSVLRRQLGFEDDEEAEDFCRTLGMKVENVILPSTGAEVITIRTPSATFDEGKVSEWESSRADVLIESKAQGFKTSEIIYGLGRNNFRMASEARKTTNQVILKKPKSPVAQVLQFSSVKSKPPLEVIPTGTSRPTFIQAVTPPKVISTTKPEIVVPPKQAGIAFNLKPQDDERKADEVFKTAQSIPMRKTLPKSPKRQHVFQVTPKSASPAPIRSFGADAALSSTRPATNALAAAFPPTLPTAFAPILPSKLVEPRSSAIGLPTIFPEPVESLPVDKPVSAAPQLEADEASRKELPSITEHETKQTNLETEKSAHKAVLKALLIDLISSSEADFEKVRKIIDDAQTDTLKFPKAMEIWDDAKDILLAVSERTERGLTELEAGECDVIDAIDEGDAGIEALKEKLRFCAHEGTELWDQLNEIFSKSLEIATAYMKDSELHTQLGVFASQGREDEDEPFEISEIPSRGAEVNSVSSSMRSVGLNRFQAIIADIRGFETDGNEVGIAQRWLRQRLSSGTEQEAGSLCHIDTEESGAQSISIREINEVSAIPYTANLIILPCDIRTMKRDPSGACSTLEQVLRKNRSIALSCDLPAPTVVVLYYCGSSDMPLWFTDEQPARKSFTAFQKALQEKGYVSNCQKLELPRTIAFQSMKCEPFTDLMIASVRASMQGIPRMGNLVCKTNLRDHLVHVANSEIGAVLNSTSLQGDSHATVRVIHRINERWKDVARRLRREEARWPKEMAERRRIFEAYAIVESRLQLPLPRKDSLTTDYISDMAAVAGAGVPATEQLEGLFPFCSALAHLMNAFVCKMLVDCPVSHVYLASDFHDTAGVRKSRPNLTYHINLSKRENQDERVTSRSTRYALRTEPPRKTKRLREEISLAGSSSGAQNPVRRRLSMAPIDSVSSRRMSGEFVSNRRRSLPALYGRRRMFELLDGICSEEQAFDDAIQATMDALTAKRRRLEQRSEIFAT